MPSGGSFSEHFYCLIRNGTCSNEGIGSLGAREKQLSLLCLVHTVEDFSVNIYASLSAIPRTHVGDGTVVTNLGTSRMLL